MQHRNLTEFLIRCAIDAGVKYEPATYGRNAEINSIVRLDSRRGPFAVTGFIEASTPAPAPTYTMVECGGRSIVYDLQGGMSAVNPTSSQVSLWAAPIWAGAGDALSFRRVDGVAAVAPHSVFGLHLPMALIETIRARIGELWVRGFPVTLPTTQVEGAIAVDADTWVDQVRVSALTVSSGAFSSLDLRIGETPAIFPQRTIIPGAVTNCYARPESLQIGTPVRRWLRSPNRARLSVTAPGDVATCKVDLYGARYT